MNKPKRRIFSFEPVTVFILLTLVTIIISGIGTLLNWQGTYETINLANGARESVVVTVQNMFSISGIQYIISNSVTNFASFAPLATLIIAFMGIGVIEKSGLFHTLFGKVKEAPVKMITFIIILLSILSSLFGDVGFVILMPIAALIFMLIGRNPVAGLIASFAGITGGAGANLIVSSIDMNLATFTGAAAELIDQSYIVSADSNWFFIITATLLLSIVGTFITEKWIVPRLGEYKAYDVIEDLEEKNVNTKKGLIYAGISALAFLLLIGYLVTPFLPGGGILLNMEETGYINQLLGYNTYFSQGIPFIFALLLLIPGLFYGIGSGTIRSDKDFFRATNSAMKDISKILILMFFVAQFIAVFKKTEIGTLINVALVNMIEASQFQGIALILLVFFVAMIGNLFITSTVTKWMMFAPVVVPLAMLSNITPEYMQAVFRAGDSITNGITPLLAYFVVFIALVSKYNSLAKKPVTYMKAIRMIYPYALSFGIVWLILLLAWYIIGLPIGPNIYPLI